VGGYINAYTSREMTAYYARILKDDVALALDVIGDIVLNPAFDPKEIEVERHVILQEIGQALDTPDDIIFDWLQEVSYPDQSFGRTILGPAERVAKFARADLQTFVKDNYGPAQMILSAAGGVDHDAIVKQAEAIFGSLTARPQAAFQSATFKGAERREVKDLEQVHFAMAFDAPGYRHPDVYAAQVYSMVMGGGMSSRLFQKIRAQIKAGMLMGLESPSSRAERIARLLAIYGRVPDVSESVAKIDAVTTSDVRRYGEGLCSVDNALALYGPVAAAPSLEEIRQRLAA
jgi:predicted Zn-dependent peptidase